MKRYTPLLLLAFAFVFLAAAGSVWLTGHADRTGVEMKPAVTVYTTLPAEQAGLLAASYEELTRSRVDFIPLTPDELTERLRVEGKKPGADMVLADSRILRQGAQEGAFVPYFSEQTDSVPETFKDEDGAWIGVWYDPVVFCANSDYLRTLSRIPQTWEELANYPDVRLGMTDLLAADAAANFYFSLLTVYGEKTAFQILSAMHPKVVQYVKYLSTPVRMAGMGEVDIALAVQSETLRYLNNGYPLRIIYPADGTAYMLTGAALLRDDYPPAAAFAEWLLGDDAQFVLQGSGVFFVPANAGTLAYKMLAGKNITLFEPPPSYTAAERYELLDRWLREIRFR